METRAASAPRRICIRRRAWITAACWCSSALIVLATLICHAKASSKPKRPNPKLTYVGRLGRPGTGKPTAQFVMSRPVAAAPAPQTAALRATDEPFVAVVSRDPVTAPAAPFIEVAGPPGMRAWSDGTRMIHVKGGKLVASIAVRGSQTVAEPVAGTPLYRANGTFAGWIGPDSARPPNIHSLTVPAGVQPVVAENSTRFGDVSEATGRAKTVYVNAYYRADGTYVRSHWRSAPEPGNTLSDKSIGTGAGVAENGSYYGQISHTTGLPKTTYVNGYYRSNGTYVRGHYRSR